MAPPNSSTDHQQLNEADFVPIEVVISVITALISFVGIALNASLVHVTVKTKSLHSQCNVLIALYAFSAIFMFLGFTVKFFIFLFGINFVTLKTCFYLQFINRSACTFAIMMQLCIGLDRLAGVSFPIWYQTKGKYSMFKILVVFSFVKVVVDKCIDFYGSSLHWEKLVRCDLADPANQPEILDYTINSNSILFTGEFVCYSLIWLIRWLRKTQFFLTAEVHKKLLLSLSVIMSINFCCYIVNTFFFQFVVPWLNLDMFTVYHITRPIAFVVFVFGHCSSVPILFICSTEYRRAFQTIFWQNRQVTMVQILQRQPNIQTVNVDQQFS